MTVHRPSSFKPRYSPRPDFSFLSPLLLHSLCSSCGPPAYRRGEAAIPQYIDSAEVLSSPNPFIRHTLKLPVDPHNCALSSPTPSRFHRARLTASRTNPHVSPQLPTTSRIVRPRTDVDHKSLSYGISSIIHGFPRREVSSHVSATLCNRGDQSCGTRNRLCFVPLSRAWITDPLRLRSGQVRSTASAIVLESRVFTSPAIASQAMVFRVYVEYLSDAHIRAPHILEQ